MERADYEEKFIDLLLGTEREWIGREEGVKW